MQQKIPSTYNPAWDRDVKKSALCDVTVGGSVFRFGPVLASSSNKIIVFLQEAENKGLSELFSENVSEESEGKDLGHDIYNEHAQEEKAKKKAKTKEKRQKGE